MANLRSILQHCFKASKVVLADWLLWKMHHFGPLAPSIVLLHLDPQKLKGPPQLRGAQRRRLVSSCCCRTFCRAFDSSPCRGFSSCPFGRGFCSGGSGDCSRGWGRLFRGGWLDGCEETVGFSQSNLHNGNVC